MAANRFNDPIEPRTLANMRENAFGATKEKASMTGTSASVPDNISSAFGEALILLIQWRGGADEPVVSLDGNPFGSACRLPRQTMRLV